MGLGNANAALAGMAMMLAHGFFKATLFLVVGIIDHKAGTRDLHQLSGLYRSSPLLFAVAALAAASMAGFPPLLGFVAKESVYEALLEYAHANGTTGTLLLVGVVLGAIMTFAYSARFLWGGFATKKGLAPTPFPKVPALFLAPLLVLTVATVVFAWVPGVLEDIIDPYVGLFPAAEHPIHLGLWHGFTPALGLSALTMLAGAGLFLARERVFAVQSRVPALLDADRDYKHLVNGVDNLAIWLTGRTQRGSLSFYLVVILTVALVVPDVRLDLVHHAGAGQLHRLRFPGAAGDRGHHHHRRHRRGAGRPPLPGRAHGLGHRLRHGRGLRPAGRPGPRGHPAAGRDHRAGRLRAGAARAARRDLGQEPHRAPAGPRPDRHRLRRLDGVHRRDGHGLAHRRADLAGLPGAGLRRAAPARTS